MISIVAKLYTQYTEWFVLVTINLNIVKRCDKVNIFTNKHEKKCSILYYLILTHYT